MAYDTATAIVGFYSHVDVFMLILLRLVGFAIIVPVLSGANIPNIAKVSLSVFIAFIIFTSNRVTEIQYYDGVIGYGLLLIQEFIVGFTIGFVVYVIFTVVYFAGQLIDFQIGFSMVSVFDPVNQLQVPIVGNLLYYIMAIFLIQSGGFNAFIQAICYSYDILPIGHAVILGNESLMRITLSLLSNYFMLGTQIAMPVVGSILILDVAFGILIKATPQMNIFTVGMPIKVLLGLCILYYVTPIFLEVYNHLYEKAFTMVIAIIKGLAP